MDASDGAVLLSCLLLSLLALVQIATGVSHWRRARRQAEFEARAAALLRDALTEEERRQLSTAGYLAVASPGVAGRVYRVPARGHPVLVYESGRLIARLCLQPMKPMPAADMVLMHKLMIEGNEREYLRTANAMPETAWPRTMRLWW